MLKALSGNPSLATNADLDCIALQTWHLATTQLLFEGQVSMPTGMWGASTKPATALGSSENRQSRNDRKHPRRGLLMQVPLLLQLAVALDSVHFACAFIGMPSAGYIFGDTHRSPNRRRVVCSDKGSLSAATNSPEPLEQEQPYGFWAPATEDVALRSVQAFHVRVRSLVVAVGCA